MTEKLYLCGAMRGFPSHNYPLFNQVAAKLREQGFDIVNPAEIEGTSEGVPREVCMQRDFEVLLTCTGIAALPGWKQSPGACTEVALGWSLNLPLYDVITDSAGEVSVRPSETTLLSIPRESQYYAKTPLVGLCGYAQSGKDTTAQHLLNLGWHRVAFADTLRDVLDALNPIADLNYRLDLGGFATENGPMTGDALDGLELQLYPFRVKQITKQTGWDAAKTTYPEIRKLLQRLGTEAGRDIIGEHLWVHKGEEKIEKLDGPVVVTDVRFQNELFMIRRRGGVILWVERPGVGPVNNHASEHSVLASDADYVINNDGTIEDLERKVQEFLHEMTWQQWQTPELAPEPARPKTLAERVIEIAKDDLAFFRGGYRKPKSKQSA